MPKMVTQTPKNTPAQPKRVYDEKEKALLRKYSNLTAQVHQLERRCNTLKAENQTLRKGMEILEKEQKPNEEKMKKLKRRNAELAVIGRKLEDKLKQLQNNTMKKWKTDSELNVDQVKKAYSRQRAKDHIEFAKTNEAKDKEICKIKLELKELKMKLADVTGDSNNENGKIYQDKLELEKIIRHSARERLTFEKQIARLYAGRKSEQEGTENKPEISKALLPKLASVETIKSDKHNAEVQTEDSVVSNCKKCKDLNCELKSVVDRNKHLDFQILEAEDKLLKLTELTQAFPGIQPVSAECHDLKVSLAGVESECQTAKTERDTLLCKVDTLEAIIKHMRETAEKRKELEKEHQEAVGELRTRQEEVRRLHKVAQESERRKSQEAIEALESKLRELETKYELQAVRHEELLLELISIKKQAYKQANRSSCTVSAEVQTSPESGTSTPDSALRFLSNGDLTGSPKRSAKHQLLSSSLDRDIELAMLTDTSIRSLPAIEYSTPRYRSLPSVDIDSNYALGLRQTYIRSGRNIMPALPSSATRLSSIISSNKMIDSGGDAEEFIDENITTMTYLDVPGRGRVAIFVARYNYDPLTHSPNENPESELAVNAGEYVLVHGEMDEDGFYDGEMLDGRRGLVPSNFVERLPEEELLEFQTVLAIAGHISEGSVSNTFQHEIETVDEVEKLALATDNLQPLRLIMGELEEIKEVDEETLSKSDLEDDFAIVPHPRQLTLERQLHKSILISWQAPDTPPGGIDAYHVYVDGELKTTVKGTERTRALVEGVESTMPHRISVRAVTAKGQSKEQECTMVLGKDIPPAPSQLHVSDITPTSALISWLPSNSNFYHTISVNNVEVKSVKPGVYKYEITGLIPASLYKVTVAVRNARVFTEDEKKRKVDSLSSQLEFRTLPDGLPDPPLDVQIETGPQHGSFLVTWLPVTMTTGISNGAPVTGYAIYADGRKISEVNSPTGDHVLLDWASFEGSPPRTVTVRTLAKHIQSVDSVVARIPDEIVHNLNRAKMNLPDNMPVINVTSPSSQPSYWNQHDTQPIDRAPTPSRLQQTTQPSYWNKIDSQPSTYVPSSQPEQSGYWNQHDLKSQEHVTSSYQMLPEEKERDYQHDQIIAPEPIVIGPLSPTQPQVTSVGYNSGAPYSTPTPGQALPLQTPVVSTADITTAKKPDGRSNFRPDYQTDSSDRSELSDIAEEAEEEVSENAENFVGMSADPERTPVVTPVPVMEKVGFSNQVMQVQACKPGQPPSGQMQGQTSQKLGDSVTIQDRSMSQQAGGRMPGARMDSKERDKNLKNQEMMNKADGQRGSPMRGRGKDMREEITKDTTSEGSFSAGYSDEDFFKQHSGTVTMVKEDSRQSDGPKTHRYHSDHRSNYSRRGYQSEGQSIPGRADTGVVDNRVRIFVALFDYDPISMSPNQDGAEEELPFREGQLIKVYGDKDADGFYKGESNNHTGFVPCNMVTEIHLDDEELAQQLLAEVNQGPPATRNTLQPPPSKKYSDRNDNRSRNAPVKKMVALYDYDPQELSPNVDAEVELSFQTGDIVYIFGDMDEDGFYMGEVNGIRGLVPSNFLTPAPPDLELEYGNALVAANASSTSGSGTAPKPQPQQQQKQDNVSAKPQEAETPVKAVNKNVQWQNGRSSPGSGSRDSSPDQDIKKAERKKSLLLKGKNFLKKFTR